ncbi:MAG: Nif3-like dinuclear metal center hexameric protein [Planctomycetota bacterium]
MPQVSHVVDILKQFAPLELAEDWDNVGLLVGDPERPVQRVMTCLTLTPATAAEAVRESAQLVVSHHPVMFRPVQRLTTADPQGKLLLDLAGAGVAVYSAHTAFDSAETGINAHLALGLDLHGIQPLAVADSPHAADVGAGRYGLVGESVRLEELVARVKSFLGIPTLRVVGPDDRTVQSVAIACGSGGSMLAHAASRRCDCMLTGEAAFHTCLEAEALGISLILPGHYASERFAMEALADYLGEQLPDVRVWASQDERDPLRQA